jgi:hypothetical protein
VAEAEVDAVIAAAGDRAADRLADRRAVIGMNQLEEGRLASAECFETAGRKAEDLLHLDAPPDAVGQRLARPGAQLAGARRQ